MKFCDTHYSSIVFHHLVLWFFSVIYMCSHFESLISSSPLSLYFPLSSYSPFLSFLSSSSFSSSPVNPEHGETAHQSSKTGTSCTYCTQIYKSVSQLNFGRNLFRQHITTVHTLLVYMYMCVLFKAVLLKIKRTSAYNDVQQYQGLGSQFGHYVYKEIASFDCTINRNGSRLFNMEPVSVDVVDCLWPPWKFFQTNKSHSSLNENGEFSMYCNKRDGLGNRKVIKNGTISVSA